MRFSRTSFLAFVSLMPIGLALPASAQFTSLQKDTLEVAYRDIGGKEVGLNRCHWYNFHQTISLWPSYIECGGKSATEWFKIYHSAVNANGFSNNALTLIQRQNRKSHDKVYTDPKTHITLEINKHYDKTACAWFNYIHSRIRTPLYLKCDDKTHQASYGMYSAPNFLKDFRIKDFRDRELTYDKAQQGKAAPILTKVPKFGEIIEKQIGATKIKVTRCEWSNFFQSISFLPRYLPCDVADNAKQLKNYENNNNLKRIKFEFTGAASRTPAAFDKKLTLFVGTKEVTATVRNWYDLVQTEYRWPRYRRGDNSGPKRDFYLRHRLLYSN